MLIIATVIYSLVLSKVVFWDTLTKLGHKLETPLNYVKHPTLYHLVCKALFLICVVIILAGSLEKKIIWLLVFIVWWYIVGNHAMKKAFSFYRKIAKEQLEWEVSQNPNFAQDETKAYEYLNNDTVASNKELFIQIKSK